MTTSEAQADLRKQIDEMKKKFAAKAVSVGDNKVQAVANACLMIEGTAKRLMRATFTAISYENPVTGRMVVNKRPRSVPGSAPAPDTGTLMRSITHDVDVDNKKVVGRVGSVITNPPYPAYLENGTSKMAARPWLRPSLDQNAVKIGAMFRKVFQESPLEVIIE
jgi:HK97 gp10 family phage protein